MKKKLSLIYVLSLIIINILSCFNGVSAELMPPVTDNAGYLDAEQVTQLSAILDELRQKYGMDVVIYTEENMSGQTAEETADDIYDYGGYGIGDSYDGIMLYLSANPRKYAISTCGNGQIIFNHNAVSYIEDKILPYLRNDDYSEAFSEYAAAAAEILNPEADGSEYTADYGDEPLTYGDIAIIAVGAIIISAIIALIMTLVKVHKMNSARKQDYAFNYLKENGVNINHSQDLYLYSNVVRTEKPRDDDNTHTSSSGRSHGGSSGSY